MFDGGLGKLSVNDLDAFLDKDTPIPKREAALSSPMKRGNQCERKRFTAGIPSMLTNKNMKREVLK
jgi:hypothetical protein